MKLKTGDKVRVLNNWANGFEVGSIVTVVDITENGAWDFVAFGMDKDFGHEINQFMVYDEVEIIQEN